MQETTQVTDRVLGMEYENYGFMNYFGLRLAAITVAEHTSAVRDCQGLLEEAQVSQADAQRNYDDMLQ